MDFQMSVEMRYLVYCALLMLVLWIPYILAELRVTGFHKALTYPDERSLPDWGVRLRRAHYNLVENMIPFSIAVIAGEYVSVHTDLTAACAMVFFWARVAHPIAQVTRIWGTRSLTFGAGAVATLVYLVALLVSAPK